MALTRAEFEFGGKPFGKQRPRHTRTGHTYTPPETQQHEKQIALAFRQQYKDRFADDAYIRCEITVLYDIPKAFSKAKREGAIIGEIRPDKKPDADNIAKIVLDALNGVAFRDDTQIVELSVEKWYTHGEPKTIVTLTEVVFDD